MLLTADGKVDVFSVGGMDASNLSADSDFPVLNDGYVVRVHVQGDGSSDELEFVAGEVTVDRGLDLVALRLSPNVPVTVSISPP